MLYTGDVYGFVLQRLIGTNLHAHYMQSVHWLEKFLHVLCEEIFGSWLTKYLTDSLDEYLK